MPSGTQAILCPYLDLGRVGEGRANIVFRPYYMTADPENRWLEREPIAEAGVTPPPATYLTLPRQDDLLRGRLIRFRKAVPSTVPYATQARWHEEVISTLFPAANLVEQILVTVPRHLREHADKMMARDTLAKIRAPHRRGVDTAKDEPHALLVTDMTPREGSGDVLIEFKPKWLAQSPSAPAGARRCRTCALRAQRNAGRRAEGQEELVSFCPLDLVSREPARIALAAEIILDGVKNLSGRRRDEVFPRFCDFLLNHDLLHRLRRLQLELDPLGVFAADVSSQSFLTATTLRDCSLYVRIPKSGETEIEARLGDLDLKAPAKGKADYWRSVEESLIDEGWYTGSEDVSHFERSVCSLSSPS